MPSYAFADVAHIVDCEVAGVGVFAGALGQNHCGDFFCLPRFSEVIRGVDPLVDHVPGRMALNQAFGPGYVVRSP